MGRGATADEYRAFGLREARGQSKTYEQLSLAVADDGRLLDLLDRLPEPKRQPNLLFAAARYLGAPVGEPGAFREWAVRHWTELAATMTARRTQTNEAARCGVLLPVLARLPQPLALLEVGASAGLCLYPDAYRYRYTGHPQVFGPADSPVLLSCESSGPVPLPSRMPTVVWRAGIDLNPLDVTEDDDLRWLETLIWPEHRHRRERLRAAVDIVRADPPHLVRGDLLADLPALAAQAPRDATLVIFHSSVLYQVPASARDAFAELVRGLPGHWISCEGAEVFPELAATVPELADGPAVSVLALDGRPLALAAPHGQKLDWLPAE
ncbi:DUF2332 domain-containing protein [Amycolatopsis sp. CA-230715]|uniref:DUF2332 domain-containing protein n=1 Tax=Amycolatopsis sp. CA-230715 TaxID=2745196 RepID=UPI001C02702A|nr:DUF2332 domain-containing protein [Amycolatopsis sp. CA-230715]QWF80526.1 hypothetical protein HUW46_03949 [Amycolatopsis sp. CA-230715]